MSELSVPALYPPRDTSSAAPPANPAAVELAGKTLAEEICANAGPVLYDLPGKPGAVRDALDLKSKDFGHRLELRNLTFEEVVDLRDTRFRRTVDLRGCTFRKGLRMEGTRVDGSLLLSGATVGPLHGDNQARAARLSLLKVGGHLLGRGLVTGGTLDLTRAGVRGHLDLSSRAGRRTAIEGNLVINVVRVGGAVRLCGVRVQGELEAEGVRVRANLTAGPLREQPERGEGAVLETTHIAGQANFSGSRIHGAMDLAAIRVDRDLNVQAAEIRGGLFCRALLGHQPVIGGAVEAPAARILTTLDLSGAVVGQNVRLDGATIQGTVFLLNGWQLDEGPPSSYAGPKPPPVPPPTPDLRTHVGGSLLMGHASVGGDISVRDAWLEKGVALTDATVSGAVSFSQSTVGAAIKLDAARVAGGFYCQCVHGQRPRIGSIGAKAAEIGAGVFLAGAEVVHDVSFAEARIKGPVEMDAKCFTPAADGGARHATAGPPPSTTVGGTVDFGHATVTGALDLVQLQCESLRLEGAAVTGALELSGARIGPPYQVLPGLPDPDADAMLRVAGERRRSLDASGLRLLGPARLSGVRVIGDVDLQTARMESGLFCGAAVVDGVPVGERPVIGGSVLLGGATILAEADFRAAWIAGDLSLERATVDGRLRLRLLEPPGNDWRAHLCTRVRQINLRNCAVDYLDLQGVERRGGEARPESGSDTAQGVPILLEGCRFREFSVPGDEENKDYLFLFRRHEGSGFRQSNYALVEHWLRERGRTRPPSASIG